MLCLNFDFYIIPLTLLLTFLKQYVMCMLLAEKNVNPEEQVHLISSLKGQLHEDFAVLSQFCAKIITLRLKS